LDVGDQPLFHDGHRQRGYHLPIRLTHQGQNRRSDLPGDQLLLREVYGNDR
jgi:hypothetical protein